MSQSEAADRLFQPRKVGIVVVECNSITAKIKALGLSAPVEMCFLPRNLLDATAASELLDESSVTTLRVLFRQSNIPEGRLKSSEAKTPLIKENAFELVLPTLFVTAAMYSENPELVNVALGVIGNYATEFFKGVGGSKLARFKIATEDAKGNCKLIEYCGPPEGLEQMAKIVGKVYDKGK